MNGAPSQITSKDNSFVKDLKRLAQENTAYRKQGKLWLEGDHLCRAALTRGLKPVVGVFSESFWASRHDKWEQYAIKNVVLTDSLLKEISGLESPAPMGFVLDLPASPTIAPRASTVILDRVQDAGNVGSILRSAAAFGFKQIIALKGTAALWSPKVLRAGMGAHFGLQLIEGVEAEAVADLVVPILATSSHKGDLIHQAKLPWPCAWAMGHEGQGVCPELMARADQFVRIGQPGGEESLNVGAAAAICLHASSLTVAL